MITTVTSANPLHYPPPPPPLLLPTIRRGGKVEAHDVISLNGLVVVLGGGRSNHYLA